MTKGAVIAVLFLATAGHAILQNEKDTHSYFEVRNDSLYYADLFVKVTKNEAVNYCESLGGQVPEFEESDVQFIRSLASKFDSQKAVWLDASDDGHGVRYRKSGRIVPYALWSSFSWRTGSSIVISQGFVVKAALFGYYHPFCVLDLKDQRKVHFLETHMYLMDERDRLLAFHLLTENRVLRKIANMNTDTSNVTSDAREDRNGYIQIRNGSLFYSNLQLKVSKSEAVEYCHSLGGRVPEFEAKDRDFMSTIGSSYASDLELWLDAGFKDGAFRYSMSGKEVPRELWDKDFAPNCTDLSACGVAVSSMNGSLLDVWSTDNSFHPLCVFDLRNESQVKMLRDRMFLVNETDRLPIANILSDVKALRTTVLVDSLQSLLYTWMSKEKGAQDEAAPERYHTTPRAAYDPTYSSSGCLAVASSALVLLLTSVSMM